MVSLAELEKMAYPINDMDSEFRKLDKIDGLLFISMIEESKSWDLIDFLVGYMEKEYKAKGISIESGKLIEELRLCEEFSGSIDMENKTQQITQEQIGALLKAPVMVEKRSKADEFFNSPQFAEYEKRRGL
jgi:hypothetical protein